MPASKVHCLIISVTARKWVPFNTAICRLFVNDSIDGKTFNTVYATSMQAIKMHGEIAWTQGEDLSWTNGITLTHYSNVKGQLAPWGLTPLEITSSLRWQLFKDFFLKGDLYGYGGAPYQSKVSTNVYKDNNRAIWY